MAQAKTVQALCQFVAEVDGHPVVVLQGTKFKSTDTVVKDNPDQFEPPTRKGRT